MSKVKKTEERQKRQLHYEEIIAKSINGMFMLILNIVLMIGALAVFIYGLNLLETGKNTEGQLIYIVLAALYLFLIGPFLFAGLKRNYPI